MRSVGGFVGGFLGQVVVGIVTFGGLTSVDGLLARCSVSNLLGNDGMGKWAVPMAR